MAQEEQGNLRIRYLAKGSEELGGLSYPLLGVLVAKLLTAYGPAEQLEIARGVESEVGRE